MTVAELDLVDRGLPRRLSVIPGTADYDDEAKHRLSGRISVLLDGVELPDVAGWDADGGVIVRNRRYKDGALVLSDEDRAPILGRLTGRVEVRWTPEAARVIASSPSPRPNGRAARNSNGPPRTPTGGNAA